MTLGDDALVAWVHPSFRDVVIDNLMQSPVERRAFLESCGSAGLELALSNAGGSRGERVRPLLQDDEDWEVIADRVTDLLRSPSFTAIRDVLSAIEATLAVGDGPSPQRLAGSALDAVLDRWTTNEAAVAFEDLTAYYTLSGRVAPLRPGPQLETTWHETCGPLESGELVTSSNVRQLFRLIEVLQNNEPRFLRLRDPGPLLLAVLNHVDSIAKALAVEAGDLLDRVDDDPDVGYDDLSYHHSILRSWLALVGSPATRVAADESVREELKERANSIRDALADPYQRVGSWVDGEEERLADAAAELQAEQEDERDEEEVPSFEELITAIFEDL